MYSMYRLKKNNHIDILVDEENSFDKIQYPFMIKKKKKTSLKNRNSGELPQFDKEYPLKS